MKELKVERRCPYSEKGSSNVRCDSNIGDFENEVYRAFMYNSSSHIACMAFPRIARTNGILIENIVLR